MSLTSLRWSRAEEASLLPACRLLTRTSACSCQTTIPSPSADDGLRSRHRVVHAEQTIKILKPFPKEASSKDGWKLVRSIGGVHDKGEPRNSKMRLEIFVLIHKRLVHFRQGSHHRECQHPCVSRESV